MLSNQKIKELLTDNAIEITVSFYKNDNNEIVLYNPEKPLLDSASKNNLYSDRLKLSMGPIVKVISKKRINKEFLYKNIQDCVDLRKCDNKYIIAPGESIIILSNERIKLNGKYACLVIPRISLSDVGIVVTSAYVDPYYQGLMRLQLSNLSNKPYELSTLESVAQCFFFALTDEVSTEYSESFSTKSVFYGQTWQGILESDRLPFPTKKQSAENAKFETIKYQFGMICEFLKKHSIIFLLVTNFLVIGSGYLLFKQDYSHYKDTVSQIENWLEPESSEIIIEPNDQYGEKEIIVETRKSDIITILCNNDDIHFELFSGNTENETRILFSYNSRFSSQDKREIAFSYVIVRRTT